MNANIKQSSTELALNLLGQEHRSWLTTMDETQDNGCYEPGSDEEAHFNALAEASYRVANVFLEAHDLLAKRARAR